MIDFPILSKSMLMSCQLSYTMDFLFYKLPRTDVFLKVLKSIIKMKTIVCEHAEYIWVILKLLGAVFFTNSLALHHNYTKVFPV